METYYLVDFENVGTDGLSGCDKLTQTDHCIIFFTENAKKIDMSEIADHGSSVMEMIQVPAGKQSADIHIGSYLGYLAGIHKDKGCKVIIVSKDTDFDNVIKFWKNKTGIKASRTQKIKNSVPKTETEKKTKEQKKETVRSVDSENKKLSREIRKALTDKNYEPDVVNTVVQIVTNLCASNCLPSEVHNALQKKYTNAQEIYKAIKSVLSKHNKTEKPASKKEVPAKASGQDKDRINTEVMQSLAKEGYSQDDRTAAASIVVKNLGVNNSKQQIYLSIVKKFGQAKGLKIYNQIKKLV